MHRCVPLLQLLVLKVHLCQGVKVMQSQDGQNYLLYGVALNKRPLLWLFESIPMHILCDLFGDLVVSRVAGSLQFGTLLWSSKATAM